MKKELAIALSAIFLSLPLSACGKEEEVFLPTPPAIEEQLPEELPEEILPEETLPEEAPESPLPEQPDQAPEPPAAEQPTPEPTPEPEPDPVPVQAQYIYVKSDGVNVRAGAGTSYTSLGQVESDILLKYVEKTGNWYKTYYKNRTAYISANSAYTSVTLLDKGETDVENVIEEGLRLLGVPYVYGAVRLHDGAGNFIKGFTVKQFDCSSLMQYIFYEGAGVLLNTTTRTQVSQGKAVSGKLKRGDLLFFTNSSRYYKTGVERIGHVALYLGNNYILHTASDYAKIEQISSQRWNYYITARRFF